MLKQIKFLLISLSLAYLFVCYQIALIEAMFPEWTLIGVSKMIAFAVEAFE